MIPVDFIKVDVRIIDNKTYATYRVDMMDYNGNILRGFNYDVYDVNNPDKKIHSFVSYPTKDDIRNVLKTD